MARKKEPKQLKPLPPRSIDDLLSAAGWDQIRLAKELQCSRAAIGHWIIGRRKIPFTVHLAILMVFQQVLPVGELRGIVGHESCI